MILSSADYDADIAERYGWVTRTLPDTVLAARLAGFDRAVLAAAKAQVNRASLPPAADLLDEYAEYSESLSWSSFQQASARLGELFAEHGVDVELRLGDYLGTAG